MVKPKRSMSTEEETLLVSVLPYRCLKYPTLVMRQTSNLAILTDSKIQNASLFHVHAMFRHDCPLAVKPASRPRSLVHTKKNLEKFSTFWYATFLLCLSWLLRSRVRKFRRDLWITLYVKSIQSIFSSYGIKCTECFVSYSVIYVSIFTRIKPSILAVKTWLPTFINGWAKVTIPFLHCSSRCRPI
jgi:hypothetical protein